MALEAKGGRTGTSLALLFPHSEGSCASSGSELWTKHHPPGSWLHNLLLGKETPNEVRTNPVNQPEAMWVGKAGVLSTLEHNLEGGGMGVGQTHLFGPISSPRGYSWRRAERGPPCIGSLLLGLMGRRYCLWSSKPLSEKHPSNSQHCLLK